MKLLSELGAAGALSVTDGLSGVGPPPTLTRSHVFAIWMYPARRGCRLLGAFVFFVRQATRRGVRSDVHQPGCVMVSVENTGRGMPRRHCSRHAACPSGQRIVTAHGDFARCLAATSLLFGIAASRRRRLSRNPQQQLPRSHQRRLRRPRLTTVSSATGAACGPISRTMASTSGCPISRKPPAT